MANGLQLTPVALTQVVKPGILIRRNPMSNFVPNSNHSVNFTEVQGTQDLFSGTKVRGEETIIAETLFTGFNAMIVDTSAISPRVNKKGADLWRVLEETVVTGSKLFGVHTSVKAEARASVAAAYWQDKFSKIHVKQATTHHRDLLQLLKIGSMPRDAFVKALQAKFKGLKLFIADNLADYLPTWLSAPTVDNAVADIKELHDAFVDNSVAVLAILDKADLKQADLAKAINKNAFGFNIISVREDAAPEQLRFRVKGPFGKYRVNLEMLTGEWRIVPTTQATSVVPTANAATAANLVAEETKTAEVTQTEDKVEAAA
jgi:uncharacterized protein YjbI with pentapeptide repeats